jgi:hypothetical protein
MHVTFEAVKEQLQILGHSVPDSVVRSFLADMNKPAMLAGEHGGLQASDILSSTTNCSTCLPQPETSGVSFHEVPPFGAACHRAINEQGEAGTQAQTTIKRSVHIPSCVGSVGNGVPVRDNVAHRTSQQAFTSADAKPAHPSASHPGFKNRRESSEQGYLSYPPPEQVPPRIDRCAGVSVPDSSYRSQA